MPAHHLRDTELSCCVGAVCMVLVITDCGAGTGAEESPPPPPTPGKSLRACQGSSSLEEPPTPIQKLPVMSGEGEEGQGAAVQGPGGSGSAPQFGHLGEVSTWTAVSKRWARGDNSCLSAVSTLPGVLAKCPQHRVEQGLTRATSWSHDSTVPSHRWES